MSSRFSKFVSSLNEWIVAVGQARAWSELRMMGDLRLQQLGFSPELIKKGPEYFPWRQDDVAEAAPLPIASVSRASSSVADAPANSGAIASHDQAA